MRRRKCKRMHVRVTSLGGDRNGKDHLSTAVNLLSCSPPFIPTLCWHGCTNMRVGLWCACRRVAALKTTYPPPPLHPGKRWRDEWMQREGWGCHIRGGGGWKKESGCSCMNRWKEEEKMRRGGDDGGVTLRYRWGMEREAGGNESIIPKSILILFESVGWF